MQSCPCGSLKDYPVCCGAFISGIALPATPEQLMRSRYTAYTQANIAYIERTMKGKAMQGFNAAEAKQWAQSVKWLGLSVRKVQTKPPSGWVEFIAYYEYHQTKQHIHEISEFLLQAGQWYYVSGQCVA